MIVGINDHVTGLQITYGTFVIIILECVLSTYKKISVDSMPCDATSSLEHPCVHTDP